MKTAAMRIKAFTCILSLVLLLQACTKPGNPDNNTVQPIVTTTAPTAITSVGATFGGNITSLGNQFINSRGVCISTNANPTGNDIVEITGGSGTGPYTLVNTMHTLNYNTLYHVRAFVQTSTATVYGNDLTFTTLNAVANITNAPTDIITKSAVLMGRTDITPGTLLTIRGFCLKTSPSPLISDINVNTGANPGDYSLAVNNLQPNTTYYVRSYSIDNNNQVFYGNEISFKTTGYLGASGGYVFYDKGTVTNGWRFMEIAPTNIHFNVAIGQGALWGCYGSLVSQTLPDFGKGLENTLRIMAQCASANCAARVCRNYSINGLNDWFLPSKDELTLMLNSLIPINHPLGEGWTSTEFDQGQAYYVYRTSNPTTINSSTDAKLNYHSLWPIRRF
jgi:hypothetical protein